MQLQNKGLPGISITKESKTNVPLILLQNLQANS
jgi:hypothetical protein